MKKLISLLAFGLAIWSGLFSFAAAQTLKIQIPFAPGFYGDIHARSLAEYLTKHGVETAVINSTTGGGNLALETVVNDHNSRIITQGGAGFLSFYVNTKNPYGAIQTRFFYPVGWNQWIVYARPGLKFEGTKTFNKASYASSGVGSSSHLYFAKIGADLNANMIHLPYKGSAAAAVDVAAGRVDFMIDTTQAMDRLSAMGIQPLFILSDNRSTFKPQIPTAAQAGVKSLVNMYEYSNLYYVMNANFDPAMKEKIVRLMQEHNLQFSAAEYEQKFGVKRPASLNTDQVDENLKKHASHVMELQKQFLK